MTTTNSQEQFAARLAVVRSNIEQRHAERAAKARGEASAAEAKATAKAKRRADAQAAAIEERRLAHEARADELRRDKNRAAADARQAARPKAPAADAFPPIVSDGIVRAPTLVRETWDGLHQNAQRRLLQLSRPDMTPADAARAVRLLDATPATLGAMVREEILKHATTTKME